ncbi:hypothetical protein CRYUN_Cryun28dG0076000 [Craigia yunnanensis]
MYLQIGKEAEYTIEEDDKYYVGVINSNPGSMTFGLNVTSKVYDVVEAMKLIFQGDIAGCLIVLSSVGFFIIIILLVLKYLGGCGSETTVADTAAREIPRGTETNPILPEKPVRLNYGTTAEEDNGAETVSSSSSSKELYDAKLSVICYDDQRNCFFVPCGHCATCYDCAQRIMEEDNKMRPICRRLIHKVRRLFSPYNKMGL